MFSVIGWKGGGKERGQKEEKETGSNSIQGQFKKILIAIFQAVRKVNCNVVASVRNPFQNKIKL